MESGEFESGTEIDQKELDGFATQIIDLLGEDASRDFPVKVDGEEKVATVTGFGSRETDDLFVTMATRDKEPTDGTYLYKKILLEFHDGRFSIAHKQGVLEENQNGELIDPTIVSTPANGDPAVQLQNIDKIQSDVEGLRDAREVLGDPIEEFNRKKSILAGIVELEKSNQKKSDKIKSVARRILHLKQ